MPGPLERPRSTDKSFHRFCPFCAVPVDHPRQDGRVRPTCPRCGYVQWRNPVAGIAGVIREAAVVSLLGEETVRAALRDDLWRPMPEENRVLLVRRAASYRGSWCLPCGYVEFDEEIREALTREMAEETGLAVDPGEVIAVHSNFHDPDNQSVGIWFEARPRGGTLSAGDDADRLAFFDPRKVEAPLAFPTDARVLRELAAGRPRG
jgi:ADP-ribose pyrophosphatase YjhB (NUDIX family)